MKLVNNLIIGLLFFLFISISSYTFPCINLFDSEDSQSIDRTKIENIAYVGHKEVGYRVAISQGKVRKRNVSVPKIIRRIAFQIHNVPKDKKPIITCDFDGTIANARRAVVEIFEEWLEQYNGPKSKEISKEYYKLKVSAQKSGDDFGFWDAKEILERLGYGFTKDALEEAIAQKMHYESESEEENSLYGRDDADYQHGRWKKRVKMLKQNELTNASAYDFFKERFFSPERKAYFEPIVGVIKLVKIFQKLGIEMVYITLRGKYGEDEFKNQPGVFASQVFVNNNGIGNGGLSTIVYTPRPIDWERVRDGLDPEPSKTLMIKKYLEEHPEAHLIASLENDPSHINSFIQAFGVNVYHLHIQGDIPKPSKGVELNHGITSLDPEALDREIELIENQ
ncbi:MAG: hypothetical protein ABIA04_14530 [Pseudomonadota bacterium]